MTFFVEFRDWVWIWTKISEKIIYNPWGVIFISGDVRYELHVLSSTKYSMIKSYSNIEYL